MQMTLLSITVWFTHFLIASALYFNTESTYTHIDYTQTTQITPATTTTTNQEPESLIKTTPSSEVTEVRTQQNTSPPEKNSQHQYNSSPSENDTMDDGKSIDNAADVAMSHANTSQTTVPTTFTRLTPQKDKNNVTETISSVSFNDDGHTAQPNTTPNVTFDQETTSLHQYNSSLSSNHMVDYGVIVSNASEVALNHTNTSHATVPTHFARLTPQKGENNETGTMSNVSYNDDGRTVQPKSIISDLFKSVSTVAWKDRTEKGDETINTDEGNYKTNSTLATFANTSEESRGPRGTEGSYSFKSEHREEHYDTTASTIAVSARNDWSTSQNTDTPMITPVYSIPQDSTVTDDPEYHTSISGTDHSTTPRHIYRFTNSVAHIERENMTGTDTPTGTANNNNSTITDVLTDNGTNATINKTNKPDTESKEWHTCLDPESQSRQSRIVCFITVWILAMTATIFLGISIFLWVRLSFWKKQMKRKEKGGHVSEKESLWADPKSSVQERVEFWYVNGSTLEADRKEKDRRRKERMKTRGREQDVEENELWIQHRVTMDDITEFWYANRRMKEEKTQDI